MKLLKTENVYTKLRHNKSGMILFVVLWVIIILTGLAVGLGRNTSIDISLTKNLIGKAKARYYALSGILYSISKLKNSYQNTNYQGISIENYIGMRNDPEYPMAELFNEKRIGNGYFSVYYKEEDQQGDKKTVYGFQDEERKININALSKENLGVFIELILYFGYDKETAKTIAHSALDWKDSDDFLNDSTYGAEDDYYEDLGYKCKNSNFDSKEELFLVNGMTKDIFSKIKDYITVFPKNTFSELFINFETASSVVLKSLARAYSGQLTNTGASDADSLVEKIVNYRRELLNDSTQDQFLEDVDVLGLNQKEISIFLAMIRHRTMLTSYFYIKSYGHDNDSNVDASAEAVVNVGDLDVMYWKED